MSEEEFLERLKEYLTNRYNKKDIIEKRGGPYEPYIGRNPQFKSPEGTELKWYVRSSGEYPGVYEDADGKVFVLSPPAGDFYDVFPLQSELIKFFRRWRRRHHRYEKFDMELEFHRMMVDRRRWKEIEEDKDFKWMIDSFREKEEIAKKVSEKTGFKVVYYIPPPGGGNRFYFYTCFDSKGMSDEEKMKTIERAIDAMEEAYNLWRKW
ncbi:MAG: hypothetical protein QXG01_08850 [Candidatus Bathyarchaeia archaeon]